MRRLLVRLLLLVASVVVALVVAEIALRIFMPQPIGFDTGALWEPVDGLRWRRRPNLDVRVNTGERQVRVVTDSARHRIAPTTKGPGKIRILAIGDSMVEALQVDAEQSMPELLARSLSTRLGRQVEVVNAGVGGWDPNQYLTAAVNELDQGSYQLVMIFVFLDNDLVGRRVVSYPAATDLTMPRLRPFSNPAAETLDVLQRRLLATLRAHSHLFVFSQNLIELRRIRSGNRPHLLTNALRSNANSPVWRVTGGILEEIASAAHRFGTPVIFVLLPPAHYIDPSLLAALEKALSISPADVDVNQAGDKLSEDLKRRELEVFDPTPALKGAFAAGEHNLYGHIDTHFAPPGHQVMARFLEPIVLAQLAASGPR